MHEEQKFLLTVFSSGFARERRNVGDLVKLYDASKLGAAYPDEPPTEEGTLPSYLSDIGILPKGERFSVFHPRHAAEAAKVYNYLIKSDDNDQFERGVKYFKGFLNEELFSYALSVAVKHRNTGALIPPLWQISPKHFFTNAHITASVKQRAARLDAKQRAANLELNLLKLGIKWLGDSPFTTGTSRDPEFKVAWWREDVGLNDHHHQWLVTYPSSGVNGETRDREGELFYYMHQQMLARYDAERLAVGLARVEPYDDWDAPIQEGYAPHLGDLYTPRPVGLKLADTPYYTVKKLHDQLSRVQEAIETGKFLKENGSYSPVEIDSLGAAISSPNRDDYGPVCNVGHHLLAECTDPDGRLNETGGVMGHTATAARDPIFFRWHKFIDNLFVRHKEKLSPYTADDLNVKGIVVNHIRVSPELRGQLRTFMTTKTVDLKHDIILDEDYDNVKVTVNHADHEDFEYSITVDNRTDNQVLAAFRIFLAPVSDEQNKPYQIKDQRRLFIELDKFVRPLEPGRYRVTRPSKLSSVVRPPSITHGDLHKRAHAKDKGGEKSKPCCLPDRYCGCGWPKNLLIPRGNEKGMEFDLFVMVTDWKKDRVDEETSDNLDEGTSYCGSKDRDYPDRRNMGFPFDLPIENDEVTIQSFADRYGNMKTTRIEIVLGEEREGNTDELKY